MKIKSKNGVKVAMIRFSNMLLTGCFLIFTLPGFTQSEIPISTWRMHISYNTINVVAIGVNKIFGAAANSIMVLERADNSLNSYSKLNGLTGAGITFINYNAPTDQLLVAYEDGNLDIVKGSNVTNFDRLKNSTTITGSKRINSISIQANVAYLASDYGVVVFDLKSVEIKETWRDLDVNGGKLKIYQSAFLGDSIFLATEKGVWAGNLNDNLLDYNNWKRFNQGNFGAGIQSITAFNSKIYAAVNNAGIYHYENGKWTKEVFLQGMVFNSINASSNDLLITGNNRLWKLSPADTIIQITSKIIEQPLFAIEDPAGKIWIGDAKNGLVSELNGSFSNYLPNGPVNSTSQRLKYNNKTMYNLPGGYSTSFQTSGNNKGFDSFTDAGIWINHPTSVYDITDIDFVNGLDKYYISSFGYGLEQRKADDSVQLFTENNSPLINANPPGRFVDITAVETSQDGLWIANYNANSSLQLLKNDDTWQSFSFPITATRFPTDLLADLNGYVWMVLNPAMGGGVFVFDMQTNKTNYLTDQTGTGSLPSKAIHSITLDRDGYIWVGTEAGVAYFIDPFNIFSSDVDAIKPIFENRYLLKSEKVTAIAVDGGNRKWIGTERGVWLFNSTGESLIYNFTTENSPLLSNVIRDIEINVETGEVFFATDKGIVSFRSDATESTSSFQRIKIFPNPVTAGFNGTVGISGLATDALVKITDISGKLIWQTQANGGTATWNVRDYNGNRAATGIYLVFAASQDGGESVVGKIAVVE